MHPDRDEEEKDDEDVDDELDAKETSSFSLVGKDIKITPRIT